MSAPPEIIQQLKSELTQQLWSKLFLHAADLVQRHVWHGILGGLPLHGNSAEDYLQNAIVKTLDGRRNWKPERCSLEQHLKGAIESDINHDSTKPINQKIIREAKSETDDPASRLDQISADTLSVEEVERLGELESTFFEFLEFLSDDEPVQLLVGCIYDGTLKRAEQAKALNVQEVQIDALKKRLATRMKKFRASKNLTSLEVSHA